jgi:Uma2 family endonuclease
MTPAVQPPTLPATPPALSAPPMSPPPAPPPPPPPVIVQTVPSLYRFTVEQYQRMVEAGVLTDEDKVELLDGYVVSKMPRNPPHDGTIQVITKRLGKRIPDGWDLRVQLTLVLPGSQPEPDGAVARGDETTYLHRHPTPADVGLVIEVADSTLLLDRRQKAPMYAEAGIVIYWIINLVDRQIEVHSQPSGPAVNPAYASLQTYRIGDSVPLILDGNTAATIPVADLLP